MPQTHLKLQSICTLLSCFLLFACGEKTASENSKENDALKEGATEPFKTPTAGSSASIGYVEMEIAASPKIIRSFIPEGYRGSQTDTALVSQYIRRIFQDSKGNLWFGSVGDGVCRYDGKSLQYFTTLDGFAGNSVQDIAEDKDGHLWFATIGGVCMYNLKDDVDNEKQKNTKVKFTTYLLKDGLSSDQIWSLMIDRAGTIWVGTDEGICFYDRHGGSASTEPDQVLFQKFPLPETGPNLVVRNIMQDRAGNLWFATNSAGVYCKRYGNARSTSESLLHFTEKEGLGKNQVLSAAQDQNGIIWFATDGGGLSLYDPLAHYSNAGKSFINYSDEKGSNEAFCVYVDSDKKVWAAVRANLRRYSAQNTTNSLGNTFLNFSAPEGFNTCCIQSLLQDKAGNLWIGTGNGLYRLDQNRLLHPCYLKTCGHDLQNKKDLQVHHAELSKIIVSVTKKGPWPLRTH